MTRYDDLVLVVAIDVPRWSFIKSGDDGSIDFLSPLPSPFNYGHVPGTTSEDGEAEDAVVLGPRLPAGQQVTVPARARIQFLDGGLQDPKWICSRGPLTSAHVRQVESFFRLYAAVKGAANVMRGKRGETKFLGWT